MLKNHQKSFNKQFSQKEFNTQLALVKELIFNEFKDAEIKAPTLENKQYYFASENIKCIGKSYISQIFLGKFFIGHLEYFKSNKNDFFDFNIRP
jgi:hypothetical protein